MVHWDLKVPVNMKKWWHKAANKRRLFFRGRLLALAILPVSGGVRACQGTAMPVYFIAENENANYGNLRVKIGISDNIQRRIKQLQTGSPYELKLMGWIESDNDRTLEKRLHQKYSSVNIHREWFELDASEVFLELKKHSTSAFIATNDNAFEVISYDQDGVPEYFGAWQWGDPEIDEFCPSCGWGGGMDYSENYGGMRCLNCGLMESQM